MFKKIAISSLSALTLAPTILSGAVSTTVDADEINDGEKNEQTQEVNQKEYYENRGYEVYEFENYEDLKNHVDTENFEETDRTASPYVTVSGGVVFVEGVIVGYVVDGVVINTSGQSVGEWGSDGIDGVINWF
ncbi:hypothetical protein C7H83_11290 [Tetragenococcus halophilus]|uniref:Uncharacterized protein n=1 Tax=Tetragenococcus halophilus TaxID=51669 RepID=A0A3G5FKX7_TETHA|nr:hypothetical protein [Tetragenococcus halophilus]AYW51013.1 hypothetical protein C7H83_11290 [Tetragenococcus halophilus]GBD64774.1 hypothetical protein TEHD23766T_2201 [Tetragenococcus halophilus subsp. flandriensis]